ncbi:sulfate/molybdate ABC transporter ATP-binding protein [Pseudogemmobacter sonorensis]|uniref:sulfate/molybdate ABC transporter ATP-binding protein n=1 Tax=Pseudogemmobacter sonorensis TaxID=2989681 RepID=UPI00369EC200
MTMTIANLTRRFGQTEVLRGIDLEVGKGELVALLGPSGSGKTTLLKIIAGLDWPDAGSLTIEGENWLARKAQDRQTGFVFQHYALFPHMKVRDNIAFGLTVRPSASRPPPRAIAARVEELLHFLQITPLADRYPAELSGGQRQRVALGRALAIEPKVLLLDEPFGALDAQVRRDLRRWLRNVHDAAGTTTVFVTHDQEEAFELADRVVVMGAGRIEQIGRPDDIYDHPATPFVARFLGLTVEIPVTLRAGRAEAPGLDASSLPCRAMADGPAVLFLRPADITPIPDPEGAFRVVEVSTTGALTRLRLEGPSDCIAEAEVPRRAGQSFALGQTLRLRPEAGQIFPFQNAPGGAHPAPERRDPPPPLSTIKESLS